MVGEFSWDLSGLLEQTQESCHTFQVAYFSTQGKMN